MSRESLRRGSDDDGAGRAAPEATRFRPGVRLKFNLVLLPVNVAGVLKSLQQAVTGRKIPFARTPKIANRVAAPAVFVITPFASSLLILLVAWETFQAEYWTGFSFATVTFALLVSGALTFIGLRNAVADVLTSIGGRTERRPWRRQRPKRVRLARSPEAPPPARGVVEEARW